VKQKRCGHPLRTRTAPGSSREMRVSGRPLRPGLLAFTPPSPKVRLGSKCGKSKSGRTRTTTRSASCVSSPNTHPTAHADRSRSSSARRHKRISSPCSPLSRHASGPGDPKRARRSRRSRVPARPELRRQAGSHCRRTSRFKASLSIELEGACHGTRVELPKVLVSLRVPSAGRTARAQMT
jgi:hypothetical protein